MAELTIEQAFDLAVQHHQAGRARQAQEIYRAILAQRPGHTDALHLLGVLAMQAGQNDAAVDLIGRAIAIKPNYPEALGNLGIALKKRGMLDEAIAAYRRAIALKPDHAEAHYNLAIALKEKGELDQAITAYHKAINLRPNHAEIHYNLGIALMEAGRLDEAIAAYRRAIAIKPSSESQNNLGNALKQKGQLDQAIAAYTEAIALNPKSEVAHNNLGNALVKKRFYDDAIKAYQQAIAINPNSAEVHNNLADALRETGRLDESISACRRAIALQPNFAEAINNLGNAMWEKGQSDDAISSYQRAIECDASLADAHYNLGLAMLATGDFARGWVEREWRWRWPDVSATVRPFTQKQWNGESLQGKTILLHAEQGFGDTLQFIRYVPEVAKLGGKIIIECQAPLCRLVQSIAGGWPVVEAGSPLPAFDLHCPLLSVPFVMRLQFDGVLSDVPYLRADASDMEKWRRRLADFGSSIKVGLVWAGNPKHKNDRNRSIAPAALAPLAEISGVQFFNLQKGPAAKTPPPGMELIELMDEMNDFADTAALVANLELMIAVDTSVAHLAGALGKRVWTLLPFSTDWRWMLGRQDSPWYPTMRLFRQPAIGDWETVVRRVVEELARIRDMQVHS